MPSFVALDIETTGLDSQLNAITEIGAVRFNGKRVEGTWSSLVNPGQPIPPLITQLTGITNDMVRNAPPVQSATYKLAEFVGDSPILGHNISFDLSFLQKHNILHFNEVIDTYDLASVLMPTASRYNLGSLGQQLGILLQGTHRALDDAMLTHAVFLALNEKAKLLPLHLIQELVRLSEPLDWGGSWYFQQILRDKAYQAVPDKTGSRQWGPLFPEDTTRQAALSPVDPPTPLDVDEVAALMEYSGPFSKFFNEFEQRPQQIEMVRAVTNALSQSQHLMVEAGTGTGKSFAYLVPAALWALKNEQRVVISTNTINLQDQLINKDVPDLREALGLDLRACVLKGRANYLCPRRLEILRQRMPENVDEMRVLAKILVWLTQGGQGDRNEINLNGPAERDIWTRLSAADEGCRAEVCQGRLDGNCPFYRARQAAQNAHLIVVNHALLLADVVTGSRVLPDYQYVIVDEAHHLEAASTSALSYRITQMDLARLLRELGGTSSGILGHLLRQVKNILMPTEMAAYHQITQRATDLAFRLEHDFKTFFVSIQEFLENERDGHPIGAYRQQVRILPATRTAPSWETIEMSWQNGGDTLKLLLNLLSQIHKALTEKSEDLDESLFDGRESLADIYRRFIEVSEQLDALVHQPQVNQIYWFEYNPQNNGLAVNIAPLEIGPLMEKHLWHEKQSVILTSATLTTQGDFDYIRSRLNADEADELMLGSPFDYETSTLLYIVKDIPEPNDANNYQRAIDNGLIRLSRATGGRLLALFTSYAQLKRTSQAINAPLAEHGIQVYEQGEGASENTLLENFREADKAVLLGTRAFWEGVDIPGEALSVLVITKLPFDVPSEPIIAARSELFDDPFNEYNLPEAILRFRQGFGRLIRTQSDRGVVVLLDKRILTKRYGKMFIDSLPQCTLKQGFLADLDKTASQWLNI
jgi:DNA polymerase-3 subunit epsilon/ATP-dependent DNA helicase DinG